MKWLSHRSFAMVLIIFFAVPAYASPFLEERPPPSESLSTQDAAAINEVITLHLAALHNDDQEAAFALLAPETQALFGDAERFMRVMRQEFPVLCTVSEVYFGPLAWLNGHVVREMILVGNNFYPVRAFIIMDQQPDGTWLINSLGILQAKKQAI